MHFDRLKAYRGDNPPTWKIKGAIETVELNVEEDLDETIIYDIPEHVGMDQANELINNIEGVDNNNLDETVLYDVPEHIGIDQMNDVMDNVESVHRDDPDETVLYVIPEHVGVGKEVIPIGNNKDSTNDLNIEESVRRSKRVIQKPSRYRNE